MPRERDPNEIGVLWEGEYQGKKTVRGDLWPMPADGMIVQLVPFEFTDKKNPDGPKRRAYRVVRMDDGTEQAPESGYQYDPNDRPF
jgi:hypothetical protein